MEKKISIIINTLNEENNIDACIKSVQGFADEIIVCDMYSDDRTVEIAKSHGAQIVFYEKTGFVEPARFFAISQASHEWVFVLDADERLTKKLAFRLRQIVNDGRYDVVTCWFRYWYFGDWVLHGGFFKGGWIRFFRKETYLCKYSSSEEIIHQGFETLRNHPNQMHLSREYYVDHYAYFTIEKYITKTLATYARIEAEQYFSKGRSFRFWRLIILPVRSFIENYFMKYAFKDGIRGFILCALYSGYIFAIWANLWLLEEQAQRTDESKNE